MAKVPMTAAEQEAYNALTPEQKAAKDAEFSRGLRPLTPAQRKAEMTDAERDAYNALTPDQKLVFDANLVGDVITPEQRHAEELGRLRSTMTEDQRRAYNRGQVYDTNTAPGHVPVPAPLQSPKPYVYGPKPAMQMPAKRVAFQAADAKVDVRAKDAQAAKMAKMSAEQRQAWERMSAEQRVAFEASL